VLSNWLIGKVLEQIAHLGSLIKTKSLQHFEHSVFIFSTFISHVAHFGGAMMSRMLVLILLKYFIDMHPNLEIFEDKLRQAFVNRALRRNKFDENLKLEIEDSINFRLECFGKGLKNITYISDFEFSFNDHATHIKPDQMASIKDHSVDGLISILQLQSTNDVIRLLSILKNKLAEKGVLIMIFPGNRSFSELRKIIEGAEIKVLGGSSPRFFPMIDVKDAGAIAYKSGFKNVISDVDEVPLNFQSLKIFCDFIRNTGLENCVLKRDKKFLTKEFFKLVDQDIKKTDGLFQMDLVTVTSYNT